MGITERIYLLLSDFWLCITVCFYLVQIWGKVGWMGVKVEWQGTYSQNHVD